MGQRRLSGLTGNDHVLLLQIGKVAPHYAHSIKLRVVNISKSSNEKHVAATLRKLASEGIAIGPCLKVSEVDNQAMLDTILKAEVKPAEESVGFAQLIGDKGCGHNCGRGFALHNALGNPDPERNRPNHIIRPSHQRARTAESSHPHGPNESSAQHWLSLASETHDAQEGVAQLGHCALESQSLARLAELADALDSGSSGSNPVEVQVLCFAQVVKVARSKASAASGRVAFCLVVAVGWKQPAIAHEADEPAAHQSMPTQVTAGLVGFSPTQIQLGDRSATSLAGLGVEVGFAHQPVPGFELGARLSWERPIFAEEAELPRFDDFRALLAFDYVFAFAGNWVNLALGPKVGFLASLVEQAPEELAAGLHLGGAVKLSGFVTFHTGFFAEVGFGAGLRWQQDVLTTSSSLGRLVLGWSDRF